MNLKLVGLMVLSGAVVIACGDTSGTGGSGGSGGSTTTVNNGGEAPQGGGGSTSVVNLGGGGEGTGGTPVVLNCDTGEPGDLAADPGTPEGDICSACITCSFGDNCSDELATFQGTPGCLGAAPEETDNWISCIFGNEDAVPPTTGCPDDDPNTPDDEFALCQADCATQYPGCEDAYLGALSCAACVECPVNCNAEANCM